MLKGKRKTSAKKRGGVPEKIGKSKSIPRSTWRTENYIAAVARAMNRTTTAHQTCHGKTHKATKDIELDTLQFQVLDLQLGPQLVERGKEAGDLRLLRRETVGSARQLCSGHAKKGQVV